MAATTEEMFHLVDKHSDNFGELVSSECLATSVRCELKKNISVYSNNNNIKLDGFIKTKRQSQNKKDVIRAKVRIGSRV